MSELKLYKPSENNLIDMPVNDVGPLIGKSFGKTLLRNVILHEYFSKFFGFVCRDSFISHFLSITRLSNLLNTHVAKVFRKERKNSLNAAFVHRGKRDIYPLNNEVSEEQAKKILISPADAYLNIRDIVDKKVEIFPELTIDLEKMLGTRYADRFGEGGKFLLFTLKPFHDHTIDYPTNSKVMIDPIDVWSRDRKVMSTDLVFARFISDFHGNTIFDENHRMITKMKSEEFNEMYFMVEVGAVNVNSIQQDNCDSFSAYKKAVQKSHFNFGSTVILLFPHTFVEKLEFPKIYKQDVNTSVEIKRRNVIAWDKNLSFQKPFHIMENVLSE